MPTVRISDFNWQRLQTWAIPLEDSVDDVITRVLDNAESARQCGLVVESKPNGESVARLASAHDKHGLERNLNAALGELAVAKLEKRGKSMITWRSTGKLRGRFWVTTNGSGLVYLPRRNRWTSDALGKVVHHTSPRSGWEHYDWFRLCKPEDVEYALRILKDEVL